MFLSQHCVLPLWAGQDSLDELDCSREDVHALLSSLARVNCNYVQQNLDLQVFTALRLQFRGSDKQRPSLLDLVSSFASIIEYKASLTPTASKRDLFDQAVGEFNSKVAVKNYKVVGPVKDAVRNLMRCPAVFRQQLHRHYDGYKHELSALCATALQDSSFVPGTSKASKAKYSAAWCGILLVTEEVSIVWIQRVIADFERRAPRGASNKSKASAPPPTRPVGMSCRFLPY